jgi:hypothetical protein
LNGTSPRTGHAYPLDDFAGGIEHRHRARVRPAYRAVDPEDPVFALEYSFGADGLADEGEHSLAIVGEHVFLEPVAVGTAEDSTNIRPSSWRNSRKSALMRYTTSELAVTSARKRASLSASACSAIIAFSRMPKRACTGCRSRHLHG